VNDSSDAATGNGRNTTLYGVIAILLGIIAMLTPAMTGLSITLMVGILVIGGGILRLMWAFKESSLGGGLMTFAVGGLTLLGGLVLVANPLLVAGILTIVLAAYLIVDGIVEMVAWKRLRPASDAGWMLFGGVISVLLGLMLWAQYPLAGAWAIGVLLGIKLILIGLLMVTSAASAKA